MKEYFPRESRDLSSRTGTNIDSNVNSNTSGSYGMRTESSVVDTNININDSQTFVNTLTEICKSSPNSVSCVVGKCITDINNENIVKICINNYCKSDDDCIKTTTEQLADTYGNVQSLSVILTKLKAIQETSINSNLVTHSDNTIKSTLNQTTSIEIEVNGKKLNLIYPNSYILILNDNEIIINNLILTEEQIKQLDDIGYKYVNNNIEKETFGNDDSITIDLNTIPEDDLIKIVNIMDIQVEEPQPTQKISWFKRNQMWFVPVIIVVVLLLLYVVWFMVIKPWLIKKSLG